MFSFKLIETIAHPCKTVNEDWFDWNAQAAWVMDGASGIGPKVLNSAPTDPYWLVHTVSDSLKKNWDDQQSTQSLFNQAACDAIAQFDAETREPRPPLIDRPTACLIMSRILENKLEFSTIGDCWLIHSGENGIRDFGSKIDEAVTAPVKQELKKLQKAGVAGKDLVDRLLPVEREFRAKANVDGGYAIVDLTTRWPSRISQTNVDATLGDQILLMTDGFYRLIDTFKIYTPTTLIKAVIKHGLEVLYLELRKLEDNDENCTQFPRPKIKDDVAAALLEVIINKDAT